MLSAFGRVIKTADLRRKLLFTLGMIVLYRGHLHSRPRYFLRHGSAVS